jgi:hypothetical protein
LWYYPFNIFEICVAFCIFDCPWSPCDEKIHHTYDPKVMTSEQEVNLINLFFPYVCHESSVILHVQFTVVHILRCLYNSLDNNSLQYNSLRHNSLQHYSLHHYSLHKNSLLQHFDTDTTHHWHNSIQHNLLIHNSLQHNSLQQQLATLTIRYRKNSLQYQFATVLIHYSINSLQ